MTFCAGARPPVPAGSTVGTALDGLFVTLIGDMPGMGVGCTGSREVLDRVAGVAGFVRVTTTLSAELLRRRFFPPCISSSSVLRPPNETENDYIRQT